MVQVWQLPLCADRIQGENRMVVSRRIENSGWVDEISAVERDEIVLSLGHALQGIHPVVGRGATVLGAIPLGATLFVRLVSNPEVPRCPGQSTLGHHGGIRVQRGHVFLIGKGREKSLLLLSGMSQKSQALIGMRGEDNCVESLA